MTAAEVMMTQPDYVSPRDEFGRPRPNFLEIELAAGARHLQEMEAQAKEAAVTRMRNDLAGKP